MKAKIKIIAVALFSLAVVTSCTTTYDPYGRPVQSVDPGAAAAGAAAAGVLGYAIGQNRSRDRHYHHNTHYYHQPRYRGRHYGGRYW